MTLTTEQLQILDATRELHFRQDGAEFVVLRFEDLVKLKRELIDDHDELRRILAASSAGNGWDEPGMEVYDTYGSRQ